MAKYTVFKSPQVHWDLQHYSLCWHLT